MVRTYISTFIPLPGCRLTVLSGPEKEPSPPPPASSFPSSRFSPANRFLKYYCWDPSRIPGPTLILRSLEINRAPFESASLTIITPAALNYFRLINKSRSTVCNNRNGAFRGLTGINRREGLVITKVQPIASSASRFVLIYGVMRSCRLRTEPVSNSRIDKRTRSFHDDKVIPECVMLGNKYIINIQNR